MRFRQTSAIDSIDAGVVNPAKEHLRLTGDWADAEIGSIATRIVKRLEGRIRRQIFTATYELRLDCFPESYISLPRPPSVSVQSITYVDSAGDPQTWATSEYELLSDLEPAHIRLKHEKVWPTGGRDLLISYTAGYGAEWSDLPGDLQGCILLMIHHEYYVRDGSPYGTGIQSLITQLTPGDEFEW